MQSSALEKIQKLLEKYAEVEKEGRISKYNEEMTKKDFILPLFDALGWKTADSREVTAEEKISKQRVDYGFRINGISKFFLEAKSLKEDLDNPKFFEQAVSYAWHKGCTWAVLTNFARVKILNAEWRARNYLQSHFMTLEHWEFIKRFEDLLLLSKESFEKDKLDQLAVRYGKKTKKESVDKQLLNDFTRFRDLLSKNITKLNAAKNLSEEELDESVQRILDRLIFIRNCEDRELEPKNLISNYRQWTSRGRGQLVKSLRDDFAYFDEQYNSKLFSEHLCDSLEIDNEILEEVIVGLYYTRDKAISYDFSIIDADVLGTIYEQYLSHILKKTEKRARLTENHTHRKEQGIYYTPIYVVDYIVRNTLGELLKDKKIDVETIKVLDPACGSGSFLIKAFDLLNEYYQKNDPNYRQAQLDLETGIPFKTKSRILQNNIFGVDLDKQAVEITQLNLLLKIAEKGHRLPMLGKNIKIGNSLIDTEEIAGQKAFKWEKEYAEIITDGGFDVVIGNPPYVFSRNFMSETDKKYFSLNYQSFEYQPDLYIMFLERAVLITKDDGLIGFIVPNAWFGNLRTIKIRKFILENTRIINTVYCPKETFGIGVETAIIILQKTKENLGNTIRVSRFDKSGQLQGIGKVPQSSLVDGKEYRLNFRFTKNNRDIINKIEADTSPLSELSEITRGVNAYDKYRGQSQDIITNRKYHSDHKVDESYVPELKGKSVSRYYYSWDGRSWIKYGKWLAAPRDPKFFTGERLILRQIPSKKLVATIINEDFCIDQTVFIAKLNSTVVSLKYLLGLVNSSLMAYYFKYKNEELDEVFPKVKLEQFKNLPIKILKGQEQVQIVKVVDQMLELSQRLLKIGDKLTDERARIEDETRKTDSEIDELVYKIYGLTDVEKEIVENSLK